MRRRPRAFSHAACDLRGCDVPACAVATSPQLPHRLRSPPRVPAPRSFCDNKQVTPAWTTAFVEDACKNRATVVDANTIKITWDTKAADPSPELIAASQSKPFSGAGAKKASSLRGEAA